MQDKYEVIWKFMSPDSNLSHEKYALVVVISHKLGISVLLSLSNFIIYTLSYRAAFNWVLQNQSQLLTN